jgi:hypothetical protein
LISLFGCPVATPGRHPRSTPTLVIVVSEDYHLHLDLVFSNGSVVQTQYLKEWGLNSEAHDLCGLLDSLTTQLLSAALQKK